MRPRPHVPMRPKPPESREKLFTQVIEAAKPHVLKLWEQGNRLFPEAGVKCDEEIQHQNSIGKNYYQCNPHFWQCYWQAGTRTFPSVKIDLFGQTFHVVAKPSFDAIPQISSSPRFYQLYKRSQPGLALQYGYIIELGVNEIPGYGQAMILADTCRDTYLPQRVYAYGKVKDKKENGFIWDNFDRHLFIDKFYVTTRQVNEWQILKGETQTIELDRKKWPLPALLSAKEQSQYCAFYGKRVLEAKLFDAATMSPSDLKNPKPDKIFRPETPWQRDLSKSYLGMARINPDFQLTPLDCQLAQVEGCQEKFFTTDSATWMGMYYALGFYPERLQNNYEPKMNIKMSSRFHAPASPWHELGVRSNWDGVQSESLPVAFRCYEEVAP